MADMVLDAHAPGDRRSLVTPEGVDLSLGLATAGQRLGAFLIDALIMIGTLVLLQIILAWIASAAVGGGGERYALEIAVAVWLLGAFLMRTGYFILLEGGRRAATFGKRIVGLRVVARSGERLTVESVIARNLMREVEVYLPLTYLLQTLFSPRDAADPLLAWGGAGWVLLFLLFPLFNRDRLRVGDLLAGTWVVSIPKRKLSWDLVPSQAQEPAARFTPEQLDTYGVYELQTLERVLRDRHAQTMQQVASTIRQKIGHRDPIPDEQFLTAYYAAARAHMERGLLFGRRRANKFDR